MQSITISSRQHRRDLRQERRANQLEHERQVRARRREQRLQRQHEPPPPIMAANPPELAAALQALAQAIQNIPQVQPAAAHEPLLDPFTTNAPFDLSSRAGSQAFTTACTALDDTWDGTADAFPTFIVALRVRAREENWSAQPPHGILTFGAVPADPENNVEAIQGHNLLTDYHHITQAQLTAAFNNRTNHRAIQNSKAMYRCLKASITGDLKTTVFDQIDNLPTHEDGSSLFKLLTSFTTISSLQLSMLAFRQILDFNPAEHEFKIATINTKLNHLFVLATTPHRRLENMERISHILNVYARIQQPESWAQWVCNRIDDYDQRLITNAQDFMNQAVIKYNKIDGNTPEGFKGSSTTIQEDIIAMMAPTAKRKRTTTSEKQKDTQQTTSTTERKLPPFAKFTKVTNTPDATLFKVGDSKTWNNQTWHYCDCPNHRDGIHWHTHAAEACRTRARWLKSKEKEAKPVANVAEEQSTTIETQDNDPQQLTTDNKPTNDSTDIMALLAAALNMTGDNEIAKDLIADALNAIKGS